MLTNKDKDIILEAFKMVDVKKLEVDHPDQKLVKWFRFGSFIGLDVASQIVKNLPVQKPKKKVDKAQAVK